MNLKNVDRKASEHLFFLNFLEAAIIPVGNIFKVFYSLSAIWSIPQIWNHFPGVNLSSILWAAFVPVDLCRSHWCMANIVKSGCNFKVCTLEELDAILLVKLNGTFFCLMLFSGSFALKTKGLVKLTKASTSSCVFISRFLACFTRIELKFMWLIIKKSLWETLVYIKHVFTILYYYLHLI